MSPKFKDIYKDKNDKLVPGPGSYEFHCRALRTAPNWGIGTSKRIDAAMIDKTKNIETEPA